MHDLTYATAKVKCFPTWKKADGLEWGLRGGVSVDLKLWAANVRQSKMVSKDAKIYAIA